MGYVCVRKSLGVDACTCVVHICMHTHDVWVRVNTYAYLATVCVCSVHCVYVFACVLCLCAGVCVSLHLHTHVHLRCLARWTLGPMWLRVKSWALCPVSQRS